MYLQIIINDIALLQFIGQIILYEGVYLRDLKKKVVDYLVYYDSRKYVYAVT